MKRFFATVALCSAVFFPGFSVAETSDKTSVQNEQANPTAKAGRYLKALISGSQPKAKIKPTDVSYTRKWIDGLPLADGDVEWRCLSEALYFEARGETVKGQFAVAEVIVNRVKSGRFPETLCGVIKQGTGRKFQCQFTYTCDGYKEIIAEPKAFERVSKVARVVIDGAGGSLTDGATHYHNVTVRPAWSKKYTRTAKIGVHIFYRHNYRTASND